MKIFKKIILAIGFVLTASSVSANTDSLVISQINYNGDSNDLFFMTPTGKWGDPACPNASYIHVKASVAGRQQILSIGLAAYMAGKKVQFWGTCSSDVGYFDAYYIIVTN